MLFPEEVARPKKCIKCSGFFTGRYCKNCEAIRSRQNHQKNKDRDRAAIAERVRGWRLANPEKHKAQVAAYYQKNAEKLRARSARWAAENKEKIAARSAASRAADPEKHKAWARDWKSKNKEALRVIQHNREARAKQAGALSKGLAAKLLHAQRGKCACCGASLSNGYQMDHILPLALGGENKDRNIQLLTPKCNMQKHKKHPVDFMQERGFLL